MLVLVAVVLFAVEDLVSVDEPENEETVDHYHAYDLVNVTMLIEEPDYKYF